jgi:hypothetical protein
VTVVRSATPEQFLGHLFGYLDDGWLNLFCINSTTGQRFTEWFRHDQLDEMAERAVELAPSCQVWFSLAPRQQVLPDGARGGTEDCVGITCLWVDIDVAGPNHKDIAGVLPTLQQARELVSSFPIQPTIVISTGGGYHAYWPLDEVLGRDDAAILLARWAATWSAHALERKLHVDNVFDLPRVLRVPGTVNHKNGADVEVVRFNADRRFSWSELFEATIDPPAPAQHHERRVPYTGAERPGDDFNARHTCGDVLSLAGWTLGKPKPNGDERWLHPWTPTSDESATVFVDDGHCTVWSDTVPVHYDAVIVRRPYDPFGLFSAIFHGGDHAGASLELAKRGYGASAMRELLGYITPIDLVTDNPPTAEPDDDKPVVIVNGLHLDTLADKVVQILLDGNNPPRLFRHGQTVSQFARGELEAVDRSRMVNVVERSMRPYRMSKDSQLSPARLDVGALELAMLRLLDELPTVNGVVRSPFLRSDGTICGTAGYDPASGNFLAATATVDVPLNPTPAEIAAAVAVVDDMIADFPIATMSDRAHVFAMLLTPPIRHLVPLTPLFIVDGNGPGVGKNLLTESCMYVTTGEWIQTDPLPLDAEEQRKQITALLSTGRAVALFDEAHIVTGTSLARLITSTTWGDRLLGYSKQVSYPNRLTVVALGNNVEVQGDMPRRSILIRLESPLSRPFDRQDFRHDDLRLWVESNRHRILGALLTLLRAWHQAGRPSTTARLGSFDQWASIIGGTLTVAGVEGFLSNVGEMRQRGATDDGEMEAHLEELHQRYGERSFSAKSVARLFDDDMLDTHPPRLSTDPKGYAQSLGHVYRRYSGRWMGPRRLVPDGVTHGARRWVIEVAPVDNYPKRGGLGGLGGLVLPTRETSGFVIEGDDVAHVDALEPKPSPPSPPSPPRPTPTPEVDW